MSTETTTHKRLIIGSVVSIAGDKSASIEVERRVLHSKYHKTVKRFKKYVIHVEDNSLKVGDLVEAIECRPISKRKRFKLKRVVKSGVEI